MKGYVIPECVGEDVLLEEGVALDLEHIETYVAAREETLGRLDNLGDLLVVVVYDEDLVELVLREGIALLQE